MQMDGLFAVRYDLSDDQISNFEVFWNFWFEHFFWRCLEIDPTRSWDKNSLRFFFGGVFLVPCFTILNNLFVCEKSWFIW